MTSCRCRDNPLQVAFHEWCGTGGLPGCVLSNYGAGEGIRTLDVNLGKVALYH